MSERAESVFRVLRHMLGLFAGQRHGKWWRRFISERFTGGSGDLATLREAIDGMRGSIAALKTIICDRVIHPGKQIIACDYKALTVTSNSLHK